MDMDFNPMVISNIPFIMEVVYGEVFNLFIINEDNIRKQVRVPNIKSSVSIDDLMALIKVLLKLTTAKII